MRVRIDCTHEPAHGPGCESPRHSPLDARRRLPARERGNVAAQSAATPFPQWVAAFRPRALARGISGATYDRVMGNLKPDTSVFALQRTQPEFREQTWQYLNRRVSDWRMITGKEVAREHAALLARIERDTGVDRYHPARALGRRSRPTAIRWCRRTTCGRCSPRSRRWPGASRAAAPIGKRNCSTRWSSSSAAGARRRRCSAPGPAPWATPNGCRRSGSTSASTMTATAACRRSAVRPTRWPAPRAISINRGKYRRGEHWGYEVRGAGARGGDAQLCGLAGRRRAPRQWRGVSAAAGHGAAVGAGAGRAGVPDRTEFPGGAQLQPVR